LQLSNRKDFLNYALSLMRAHNAEHSDSLPILDVAAMKHIAYVFDALIYYMRSGTDAAEGAAGGEDTPRGAEGGYALDNAFVVYDENENDDDVADELDAAAAVGAANAAATASNMDVDDEDTNQSVIAAAASAAAIKGRKHSFFQRSESTLCLGCPPPDPFGTSMQEALPLADQPQLLQPNARREDLFGIPKQPVGGTPGSSGSGTPPLSVLPARLGLSVRASDVAASPAAVNAAQSAPAAGTSTPAAGATSFNLSTAPFQVSSNICLRNSLKRGLFVVGRCLQQCGVAKKDLVIFLED
jgi:E3 ubiquitin-protein ligase EDD1